MTDAGFFRGTSADQDNRFADKQKKLLKELNFSPILNSSVNMSKIDFVSLKPWIEAKIKDILEKDDELLTESIYEHLAEKEPVGKDILVLITGFVDEAKASKFMEELWTKLLDLQDAGNGIANKSKQTNNSTVDKNDGQIEKSPSEGGDELSNNDKSSKDVKNAAAHDDVSFKERGRRSSRSSRSATPPSRSVSRSPGGNHKFDEHSRGRPRRRLQDEDSEEGSKRGDSPEKTDEPSKNRQSRSRIGESNSPAGNEKEAENPSNEDKRRDKSPHSSSRSPSRSRNRSGSRSRSRSRSYSRSRGSVSRSRSKSPRGSRSSRSPRHHHQRSRSPHYNQTYRMRRSRSRDRVYRPRSRSPRGYRRGSHRPPYRGSSFGYNDRPRRPLGGQFRRRSPWGQRRRYSPRSPPPGPRRRRTPSISPPHRRRRSPSPYNRRSRSPPPHMMNRSPPRHMQPGDVIQGGMRHMGPAHPHDMHRLMHSDMPRSPRGPIGDQRGFGPPGPMLPRSPPGSGPMLGSGRPDHPPPHAPLHGPSKSGPFSPASSVSGASSGSSRKKHKKAKKHRHKHKKSKKHRSASPDKKKKHKKHKKTKKSHKH